MKGGLLVPPKQVDALAPLFGGEMYKPEGVDLLVPDSRLLSDMSQSCPRCQV